jgi:hypothetical protein
VLSISVLADDTGAAIEPRRIARRLAERLTVLVADDFASQRRCGLKCNCRSNACHPNPVLRHAIAPWLSRNRVDCPGTYRLGQHLSMAVANRAQCGRRKGSGASGASGS